MIGTSKKPRWSVWQRLWAWWLCNELPDKVLC